MNRNDYMRKDKKRLPVCNHDQESDKNSLGYCQGILKDGIPFEAELYDSGDGQGLIVVMPVLFDEATSKVIKSTSKGNISYFSTEADIVVYSTLDIGMVDNGEIEDMVTLQRYVDYLVDNGVVKFTSDMYNGAGFYRVDILGSDLVTISITLTEYGNVYAKTPLKFKRRGTGRASSGKKIVEFSKR